MQILTNPRRPGYLSGHWRGVRPQGHLPLQLPATDLFYQVRASDNKIRKNRTFFEWNGVIHLIKEHEILASRPGMAEEDDDNEDLITKLDNVSNTAMLNK
jgi:hypothetical protein